MLTEHSFAAEGVTLNYAEGPAVGPPLVLLPGFTSHWQEFRPIIPALVSRWHLYALDYRGHGKSGRAPGHYRAKDYFADVTAFLDHHLTAPAVLLGYSMGAGLAVSYAEAHPTRTRAAIVGDMPLDRDYHVALFADEANQRLNMSKRELAGRPMDEIVRLLAERDTPVESAEAVESAQAWSELDPAVLEYHAAGRGREFFEGLPTVDLRQIACPVLVIQADPACGGLLDDANVTAMLAQLPHALHVQIPQVGHTDLLRADVALIFRQAVLTFLESV